MKRKYIVGSLQDTAAVEKLNPFFPKAFAFLRRTDLATLPAGRYEIAGEDCYAMVNETSLKPVAEGRCEAHAKYIDIQAPLSAPETLGVAVTPERALEGAFADGDCVFMDVPFETVDLKPGEFAVFFPPDDAHAPCLTRGGASGDVNRKVVVKVRNVELIPSFQVDHTKIVPGVYVSRTDEIGGDYATTFDVRMKTPNREPAIHPNAMHTIEHVVATFLRSDGEWKDRIVYWGPMGCLTGCYLIVKGRPSPQEVAALLLRAFEHCAAYDGEVPGATAVNCGNCLLHDLPMAKWEAARYVEILKTRPCYDYPQAERVRTATGRTFFDS